MDQQCKIFIAYSDSENNNQLAYKLERELSRNDKLEVTLWNKSFGLSSVTVESLEMATESSDFFIVLLTPDDHKIKKGAPVYQPRDNLIYELGLFAGAIGRGRTICIKCDSDVDLPTDIAGVTYINGNMGSKKSIEEMSARIEEHISKLGPKLDIKKELAFLYKSINILGFYLNYRVILDSEGKVSDQEKYIFENTSHVAAFIYHLFDEYLANTIPGINSGDFHAGFQFYIEDDTEVKLSNGKLLTFSCCHDVTADGNSTTGKYVMGIATRSSNNQRWRIGKTSPDVDIHNSPQSLCSQVFREQSDLYIKDTTRMTEGVINYLTPEELSISSHPVRWVSDQGVLPLGVISISANKKDAVNLEIQNRVKFSAMMISHAFSVFANHYYQTIINGSKFKLDFERDHEVVGVLASENHSKSNSKKFRKVCYKLRCTISEYFETQLVKEGIHVEAAGTLKVSNRQ